MFKIHSCHSWYQYFIPFYGQIIFHWMDIPHFFMHSSVDRHLSYFYIFTIINRTVKNFCVQVFGWTHVFISLRCILRSGVDGSIYMVTICLIFWGTDRLFSKVAAPFYILTSSVWGCQFLHILANTCYYLFDYSHPSACEVISHWGFFGLAFLHFPHN